MWDLVTAREFVTALLGFDHLTPQGIRFGFATFIALITLAPGRLAASGFEVVFITILMAVAALLVAQATS